MMYNILCDYAQVKCAACQYKVGKEGVGSKNPTYLSSYSKKTPTSKVGDELRLLLT